MFGLTSVLESDDTKQYSFQLCGVQETLRGILVLGNYLHAAVEKRQACLCIPDAQPVLLELAPRIDANRLPFVTEYTLYTC